MEESLKRRLDSLMDDDNSWVLSKVTDLLQFPYIFFQFLYFNGYDDKQFS